LTGVTGDFYFTGDTSKLIFGDCMWVDLFVVIFFLFINIFFQNKFY